MENGEKAFKCPAGLCDDGEKHASPAWRWKWKCCKSAVKPQFSKCAVVCCPQNAPKIRLASAHPTVLLLKTDSKKGLNQKIQSDHAVYETGIKLGILTLGQWNVSVHVNVVNGNLGFSRIAVRNMNVFKNM